MRTLRFLIQHTLILPLYNHFIDLTVTGRDTLQEIEPPVIFAANHVSHLDTVAILAALPLSWRFHLAPAMLQEYFSAYLAPSKSSRKRRINAALQYYLACGLFNGYPLPQRMGGIRRALKYSGELVEHGYCPLIFPEGMRSPNGNLQAFKPGVGMMALSLKVPVVPLHIEGLFKVFSVRHRWPTPGPVRVALGTPVDLTSEEDYETATAKIEAGVRKLARR
jgi:long-chain acyl-CoA synthetase